LKIGYISLERFEKQGQGIPRYVTMLYKHLIKIDEKDTIDKLLYKSLPLIGEGLSLELKSFFSNYDRYDIIHNPIGFIPIHRIGKAKYVVTVHDTKQIYPNSVKSKIWQHLVVDRGLDYTLRKADFIITNSTQTREEVIKLGFNKNKIAIANLGLDERFTKNTQNKSIKRANIFKVGYLGAFGPNKNIKFILQAAGLIKDKNIEFNIYGNKEYWYENFEQYAPDNMKFMGFAPEEKIVEIYDSFDVFVFPSLYEGFGLPILEAQARGLPVIIYKYGKIPREVRKYCFEAESSEHMAQIIEELKENGYNKKERKKAMEYARSFTWEKTAKETLKAYKKIYDL
jgi:glycosyltransferase involved in cell wall biosynthesis